MADTFTAPQAVADNAQRALEVRESKPESQRGMTSVGLARANQLANREPVSLETVRRMVAYFDRHEVDKEGTTWDEQGKGWQAWYGWGGDEGRAWARRILEENSMETKASRRHSESDMESLRTAAHHVKQTMKALRSVGYDGIKPKSVKALDESVTLTDRQVVMYDLYEGLVEEYGLFNQGIGANGAHYGPGDVNPFKAEGIMCGACVFYMEGKCEIVEGDIDPEGVCKLWIIPEAALQLAAVEEEAMAEAEPAPMEPAGEEMMTAKTQAMTREQARAIVNEWAKENPDKASIVYENMENMLMSGQTPKAFEDRNTTPAQREEMPASDFVIPETRNFPIVTPGDIDAAVSSWGRYQGDISFETFKARLIALAIAKGPEFVARLPQAWKDEMDATAALDGNAIMEEATKRFARRLMGR
jgi:hypothetical protein